MYEGQRVNPELMAIGIHRYDTVQQGNGRITALHIGILLLSAGVTRIAYILSPIGQTGGADEAVFGLMAQKILEFQDFPIYCWEANYAGALVSYVAAAIFAFFGSGFPQLRMAMFPAVVLTPVIFYLIYRELFEPVYALIGALFLIFCPYLVFYYTFSAHGGYGETYLGTALIILASWRIRQGRYEGHLTAAFALLGFMSGFFFYILFLIFPAILVFALPCLLPLRGKKKDAAAFAAGGMLGVVPMVIYNLSSGGGTIVRAASRSMNVGREDIQMPLGALIEMIMDNKLAYLHDWISTLPQMLTHYLLPDRFATSLEYVAGSVLIAVLIIFLCVPVSKGHFSRLHPGYLVQFKLFLVTLIAFQWVANLNRSRHLLPLLIVIPVAFFAVAGANKKRKNVFAAVLCLLSALHAYDLQERMRHPMFDPRPIADVMQAKGIDHFYGSYWTTYPIMFVAEGRIKGAPYLIKPNEILSDRRPMDSEAVMRNPSSAFVFSSAEKKLQTVFEKFMSDNHITGKMIGCRGTNIFWNLSKSVQMVVRKNQGTGYVIRRI